MLGAGSRLRCEWVGDVRAVLALGARELRGERADRDEAFVREWYEKEKIPFYAGRGDVRRAAQANG